MKVAKVNLKVKMDTNRYVTRASTRAHTHAHTEVGAKLPWLTSLRTTLLCHLRRPNAKVSLTCGSGSVEGGVPFGHLLVSSVAEPGSLEPCAMHDINTYVHRINGPLLSIKEHSKLGISNAPYQQRGDTAVF